MIMRTPYNPNLHEQAPVAQRAYDEDDGRLMNQWSARVVGILSGKVLPKPTRREFCNSEARRQWTQMIWPAMLGAIRSPGFVKLDRDNRAVWHRLMYQMWQEMPDLYAPDEVGPGQKEPWLLHVLLDHGLDSRSYNSGAIALLIEVALEADEQNKQGGRATKDRTDPLSTGEFNWREKIGEAILNLWVNSKVEAGFLHADDKNDVADVWTGLVSRWKDLYNEPGNRFDYLLKHATTLRQLLTDQEGRWAGLKVSKLERKLQGYCWALPEVPILRNRTITVSRYGKVEKREWYATTEFILASYLFERMPELVDNEEKKAQIEKLTRERAEGGTSSLPVMKAMLEAMEKHQPDGKDLTWWRKIGMEADLTGGLAKPGKGPDRQRL